MVALNNSNNRRSSWMAARAVVALVAPLCVLLGAAQGFVVPVLTPPAASTSITSTTRSTSTSTALVPASATTGTGTTQLQAAARPSAFSNFQDQSGYSYQDGAGFSDTRGRRRGAGAVRDGYEYGTGRRGPLPPPPRFDNDNDYSYPGDRRRRGGPRSGRGGMMDGPPPPAGYSYDGFFDGHMHPYEFPYAPRDRRGGGGYYNNDRYYNSRYNSNINNSMARYRDGGDYPPPYPTMWDGRRPRADGYNNGYRSSRSSNDNNRSSYHQNRRFDNQNDMMTNPTSYDSVASRNGRRSYNNYNSNNDVNSAYSYRNNYNNNGYRMGAGRPGGGPGPYGPPPMMMMEDEDYDYMYGGGGGPPPGEGYYGYPRRRSVGGGGRGRDPYTSRTGANRNTVFGGGGGRYYNPRFHPQDYYHPGPYRNYDNNYNYNYYSNGRGGGISRPPRAYNTNNFNDNYNDNNGIYVSGGRNGSNAGGYQAGNDGIDRHGTGTSNQGSTGSSSSSNKRSYNGNSAFVGNGVGDDYDYQQRNGASSSYQKNGRYKSRSYQNGHRDESNGNLPWDREDVMHDRRFRDRDFSMSDRGRRPPPPMREPLPPPYPFDVGYATNGERIYRGDYNNGIRNNRYSSSRRDYDPAKKIIDGNRGNQFNPRGPQRYDFMRNRNGSGDPYFGGRNGRFPDRDFRDMHPEHQPPLDVDAEVTVEDYDDEDDRRNGMDRDINIQDAELEYS